MKKTTLAILVVALILGASGCIGSPSPTKTHTTSKAQHSTSETTTTTSKTTTTASPLELLKSQVDTIGRFTYNGSTHVNLNITVLLPNMTQTNSVAIYMIERGYIDLDSMEAAINTTTRAEPDNTTVTVVRVVKEGRTYTKTALGSGVSFVNVTNDTPTFIWTYNPVSLAKKYIKRQPDEVLKNERETKLVYILDWRDVRTLSMVYLALTNETGIVVKEGRLILTFEGNQLKEVVVEYAVVATSIVKDPALGQMTVKIKAKGTVKYEITSTNKKIEVEPPT